MLLTMSVGKARKLRLRLEVLGESNLRASVFASMFAVALFLALPVVGTAQTSEIRLSAAPAPTAALLVKGIVAPATEPAHPSPMATPSSRTRLVVGGTVLGAIAGGYLGYRIGKKDLCVDSPGACPYDNRENIIKGGIVGAVTGGIAGLLLRRL